MPRDDLIPRERHCHRANRYVWLLDDNSTGAVIDGVGEFEMVPQDVVSRLLIGKALEMNETHHPRESEVHKQRRCKLHLRCEEYQESKKLTT